MYLTYHSYGKYVFYGWGYEKVDPPNVYKLRAMGKVAADAIRKERGRSNYRVGGLAKLLYRASVLLLYIFNVAKVIFIEIMRIRYQH